MEPRHLSSRRRQKSVFAIEANASAVSWMINFSDRVGAPGGYGTKIQYHLASARPRLDYR